MSRLPDNAAGKRKGISYAKWGYLFIAPFFIIYAVFNLYPLALTIYNSFFENYRSGLKQVGPNFVGLANYVKLFTPDDTGTIDILKYAGNTVVLWVGGAIPQILIALLFYTLFSNVGPVNQLLMQSGMASQPIDFFTMKITVRTLICLMNFLLWFGNTTILLMAGIMGIDQNMFEAANIDGANSVQTFFKVTLPLLTPILVYTVITALIGGLQMFDVPQVLTNGAGNPNRSSMTLIMFLNSYLKTSKNYGMAGAISVIIFIITGLLSLLVFKSLTKKD